jgi:hypothetical protein
MGPGGAGARPRAPVNRVGYSPPNTTTDTRAVSEPHPKPAPRAAATPADRRTLFERLVEFLSPGPDSRDELIEALADAEKRELIEPESRLMLEGVIRMSAT